MANYALGNPTGAAWAPNTTTGIINTSGTDIALKVFSGEVLTAFSTNNVFLPLVNVRSIDSGKSAQFPVIGNLSATTVHTPGQDIVPSTIAAAEQVITITARRYASVFVDDMQEAMSHYEVRGQYSTEIGNILAKKVDQAVVAQLDACEGATPKTGQPAINADFDLGSALSTDEFVDAMFDAQTRFDEKDVTGERVCVVNPEAYYNIVQSSKAVNRDWTSNNGGIDSGNVFKIAGVRILVSNNISSGNWGYMFTPAAVGVVKLLDIVSEANYVPEKLGTLLVSSYAMGEGVLNAGCCQRFSKT